MKRFALGFGLMSCRPWCRSGSGATWRWLAYLSLLLLVAVEFFGIVGMGAQRWIDLGFMRLQPSELDEDHAGDDAGRLLRLAADARNSRPFWVLFRFC